MTHYYEGRYEEFIYKRVEYPSLMERETLGTIEGGNLQFSAFNDLKITGTVSFSGDAVPPNDLVKIIYRFTDSVKTEEITLATCFPYCSEPEFSGTRWHGDMDLQSVLTIPASRIMGYPFTVNAGTNAVSYAKYLLEQTGVSVTASISTYTLDSAHTFKSDDTLLTICNWLLSQAGFGSCMPDAFGNVLMQPYVEPTNRTPSWKFATDSKSIMLPTIKRRRDWREAYNAARLEYSDENLSLSAYALDVDPNSETSLSQTWERTLQETVNELDGKTNEEKLNNLKAKAKKRLEDNLGHIEYVHFSFLYVPLFVNDAIEITYTDANMEWRGALTNMKMTLQSPLLVDADARRFVRSDYKIEVGGSILYATS